MATTTITSAVYRLVRDAADAAGHAVGDPRRPPGPEDPPRRFADGPHEWRTGDSVVITSDDILGTATASPAPTGAAAGRERRATGC